MQVMRFRKNSMLPAVVLLAVASSIAAPAHADFGEPDTTLGHTIQDFLGHSIQDGIRPSLFGILGMQEATYDPPISNHDGLGTDPNGLRDAALETLNRRIGELASGTLTPPELDVIYVGSPVNDQRLDSIELIPSGVTPNRGPLGADNPVPGPGVIGLFGLAALAAGRRRRRR